MQAQANLQPFQNSGSLFDLAPLLFRAFASAILLGWAQASIGSVNDNPGSVSVSPVPASAAGWGSIHLAARPTCAGSSGVASASQPVNEVPDGTIGCGVGDNFARGTHSVPPA